MGNDYAGTDILTVVSIGLELSDALSRAHHLHILHRDLKPANILMAEDGTPRLTNFGLARMGQLPRLVRRVLRKDNPARAKRSYECEETASPQNGSQ